MAKSLCRLLIKLCHVLVANFYRRKLFNAIRENKILAKISGFTVAVHACLTFDLRACDKYYKCFKISNTFPNLFSDSVCWSLGLKFTMLVRKANREDPDQTASEEAV